MVFEIKQNIILKSFIISARPQEYTHFLMEKYI